MGVINIENYKLYHGDCLEIMNQLISQGILVDMILTDLPYKVTWNNWDKIIPFNKMWIRINKLIKDDGAICLFGSEPFSSKLRISNIKGYKYDWVWCKEQGTNFLNAKRMPLRNNENISVFYKKQPTYNPQFTDGNPYTITKGSKSTNYCKTDKIVKTENDGYRYPLTVLNFKRDKNKFHSCQKPVALLEYLVKTYTNEGELVLDFTMGSGSTGVACKNTNRKFIGIELDEKYFNIAKERIGGE